MAISWVDSINATRYCSGGTISGNSFSFPATLYLRTMSRVFRYSLNRVRSGWIPSVCNQASAPSRSPMTDSKSWGFTVGWELIIVQLTKISDWVGLLAQYFPEFRAVWFSGPAYSSQTGRNLIRGRSPIQVRLAFKLALCSIEHIMPKLKPALFDPLIRIENACRASCLDTSRTFCVSANILNSAAKAQLGAFWWLSRALQGRI